MNATQPRDNVSTRNMADVTAREYGDARASNSFPAHSGPFNPPTRPHRDTQVDIKKGTKFMGS